MPTYRRVIIKLSGEALSGPEAFGIHQPTVDRFAADLVAGRSLGVTVGVVVGGGNVLRGVEVSAQGVSRPTGDAMGMLATVMNALVLEAAIERAGAGARTMSALAMPQVCETYERARAMRHLADNQVVIFAGGTGNPFFTTDTTAVLRAAEMDCDAVLKATNVDGVYTADPKKDSSAQRYERLDPPGSLRPGTENHGCDGVRACPGKPYAYHCVLDPGARRDHGRAQRMRTGDGRWRIGSADESSLGNNASASKPTDRASVRTLVNDKERNGRAAKWRGPAGSGEMRQWQPQTST